MRALTWRGLGTASSVIKHGPLTFDATGRVAYINEQLVELSARELSLLEVLLQRAGRHEDAVKHYLNALRTDPAMPAWLLGIGISLDAIGKPRRLFETERRRWR